MPWSRKLSAPIVLDDGRRLATLREAADIVLGLPALHRANSHWTHATVLMLAAAESDGEAALAAAERQLDIELRGERLLGIERRGPKRRR